MFPSLEGPTVNRLLFSLLAAIMGAPAHAADHAYALTVSSGRTREVSFSTPHPHFALKPNESLHPLLPAAGFSSTTSADLIVTERGTYTFALDSEGGTAVLKLFDPAARPLATVSRDPAPGLTASSPVELMPGTYSLSVKFSRRADSPARLRVLWAMARAGDHPGFVMEPLSARASVPKFAAEKARAGDQARHGRLLLGELGCTHCHETPSPESKPGATHDHSSHADAHAVLPRHAPFLAGAGERYSPAWIRAWLTSPQTLKPKSHMPDLPLSKGEIEAITHFLVSNAGPAEFEPPASESTVQDEGRAIYHSVGCVACHGPLDSPARALANPDLPNELPTDPPPVLLGKVGDKWRPRALSAFLQNPGALHPDGRMPSLSLSPQEGDLLASYLAHTLSTPTPREPFTLDQAKVDSGRTAFASRGCANCHELSKGHSIPSTLRVYPLPALKPSNPPRGCLDPKSTTSPKYSLSDAERNALREAIVELAGATALAPAPNDQLERTVEALRCTACHQRDGVGGITPSNLPYATTVIDSDLGDEARLPPSLTGVGWKLATPWLREVLEDGGRARPAMATRMPQFGAANVGFLPHALGASAGVWPDRDRAEPSTSDELVLAGHRLVGEDGLNCISCHLFSRFPPAGSPGPNITGFAERLRHEWWNAYIQNPPRFKPGTRMPHFYLAGKGTVTDVLSGDPLKQADAMWAYFSTGFAAPTPKGVRAAGPGTPLVPQDRPIVLRSFLKDAGSRGIAVGFPQGRHFAYDATHARLVASWTGDFLDATGAWKGRGGSITGGRGESDWAASPGPAFLFGPGPFTNWPTDAVGLAEQPLRFMGYDLAPDGTPTFRSRATPAQSTPIDIAETFTPLDTGFRRTIRFSNLAGRDVWMNVGESKVTVVEPAGVQPGPLDRGHCVRVKTSGDSLNLTLEVTP